MQPDEKKAPAISGEGTAATHGDRVNSAVAIPTAAKIIFCTDDDFVIGLCKEIGIWQEMCRRRLAGESPGYVVAIGALEKRPLLVAQFYGWARAEENGFVAMHLPDRLDFDVLGLITTVVVGVSAGRLALTKEAK